MKRILLATALVLLWLTGFSQVTVTIGSGTSTQGGPVSRFFRYHASEFIYLQSEINETGEIQSIAFDKRSGTDNNPIQSVQIYMKHTTDNSLASGTTTTVGYTLVYSGDFTNNAATGWMSVDLDEPFNYNNADNLQVLIIKGNQNPLTSAQYPRYAYSIVTPNRYRTYNDDSNAWSTTRTLNAQTGPPNARLVLNDPCVPTSSNLLEVACDEFTLNGQTYNSTGVYNQTLDNAQGCDSTITLDLTIVEIDNSVETNGVVLTANQTGATYQWMDCSDNSDISGATNVSYTATSNGLYKVRITIDDCSEESTCYTVNSASLSTSVFDNMLIYPNPFVDVIHLSGLPEGEKTIRLYTTIGQIVTQETTTATSKSLTLNNIAKGLYRIEIQVGEHKISRLLAHE